jgi:hypothetical protein
LGACDFSRKIGARVKLKEGGIMQFLGVVTKELVGGMKETSTGAKIAFQASLGDKVYMDRKRDLFVAKKGADDPYRSLLEQSPSGAARGGTPPAPPDKSLVKNEAKKGGAKAPTEPTLGDFDPEGKENEK